MTEGLPDLYIYISLSRTWPCISAIEGASSSFHPGDPDLATFSPTLSASNPGKMHLSLTTLLALAATGRASPLSLSPRQSNVPMIYLFNIPDVTGFGNSATFVGAGTPGQCQNFPTFVRGFGRAYPLDGFTCTLYFEYSCAGSAITIGPTDTYRSAEDGNRASPPDVPVIKSWRCSKISTGGGGGRPGRPTVGEE